MSSSPTNIRITLKDGRIFDGPLDHWDGIEEFISLAVDHVQHPEIPQVFGFEEIDFVVDLDSGQRLFPLAKEIG